MIFYLFVIVFVVYFCSIKWYEVHSHLKFLKKIKLLLLGMMVCYFSYILILDKFVFGLYRIPSASMEPEIKIGDYIFVNKIGYHSYLWTLLKYFGQRTPKRGDVVAFDAPDGSKRIFIKRIIGLPGDTIHYQQNQLYVNDKFIAKQMIIHSLQGGPCKKYSQTLAGKTFTIQNCLIRHVDTVSVKVPENSYFMLGDNRNSSHDSRNWGSITKQKLIGIVSYVWMHWPSNSILPTFKYNRAIP